MVSVKDFIKDVINLYFGKMMPRASAALSYYLTMTIFPLIICLYAMFGQNYQAAMNVFKYTEHFLTPSAADLFKSYLLQVANNSGRAVLVAAVTTLFLSASAAIRVLINTICELQGAHRFRAITDFLFSFLLAFALVFAVYFSIVVMLTGRLFLNWLAATFFIDVAESSWVWARFLLLGTIILLLLWGVFGFARPRDDRYHVLPGAAVATLGIVVMSTLFSSLIASSTRYSLVYGSLASLILLMVWLYIMCQIIFAGATLNIVIRDRTASRH